MALGQERQYGIFRCPVCGYRDDAEIERVEARGIVICSHCETQLELTARSAESVRFEAKVAQRLPVH